MLKGLQRGQVSTLNTQAASSVLENKVLIYGKQAALGFDGLQGIKQLVLLSPPTCCPLRQLVGRHDRPASR